MGFNSGLIMNFLLEIVHTCSRSDSYDFEFLALKSLQVDIESGCGIICNWSILKEWFNTNMKVLNFFKNKTFSYLDHIIGSKTSNSDAAVTNGTVVLKKFLWIMFYENKFTRPVNHWVMHWRWKLWPHSVITTFSDMLSRQTVQGMLELKFD